VPATQLSVVQASVSAQSAAVQHSGGKVVVVGGDGNVVVVVVGAGSGTVVVVVVGAGSGTVVVVVVGAGSNRVVVVGSGSMKVVVVVSQGSVVLVVLVVGPASRDPSAVSADVSDGRQAASVVRTNASRRGGIGTTSRFSMMSV